MDLISLQESLSIIFDIEEALRRQRQDLRKKRHQPNVDHPHRKFERRACREAGLKRKVMKTGYNAGQRDRYQNSISGKKADGTKNKIKPRRKVAGSVLNPRTTGRTRK